MKQSDQYLHLENMMALRSCSLFEYLAPSELNRIALAVTMKTVPEGETLIAIGDTKAIFYIIKSGVLSLRDRDSDGVAYDFQQRGKYEHVGGVTIFLDFFQYEYEVVAKENAELLALTRSDLYSILLNNPSSALRIVEHFAKLVKELHDERANKILLHK